MVDINIVEIYSISTKNTDWPVSASVIRYLIVLLEILASEVRVYTRYSNLKCYL